MDSRIKFDRSQKYTPFYFRLNGRKRYFGTEDAAAAALPPASEGSATAPIGPRAIAELRRARELLPPGTSLLHVVQQFLAHNRTNWSRSVRESVSEYLESRGAESHLRPRYLARIGHVMRWFIDAAGDRALASFNYGDIEELCRKRGSVYQQHEARAHLSVFFGFCLRRQWVDKNPADGKIVTLGRLPEPRREFLQIGTVRTIMDGAWALAPDLVAPFAIQLFAGLRTEETIRLRWPDVVLDQHIDVSADVSKTHERRVIDWWPGNLTSWLRPVRAELGFVAPKNYMVRRTLLMQQIGLVLPRNCFRHSYATYGVAFHQDAGKMALMLGHHDKDLLFRHYRNYATREDARAYFSSGRAET